MGLKIIGLPARPQPLVDIDALCPQIRLGHLDFLHQLGVCIGRVAECEHAPAETEEQPGAERDEGPKRELLLRSSVRIRAGCDEGGTRAYHGDNVLLDHGREGDELEIEAEVQLLSVCVRACARVVSAPSLRRGRPDDIRSSRGAQGRWFAVRASWCRLRGWEPDAVLQSVNWRLCNGPSRTKRSETTGRRERNSQSAG